MDGSEIVFDDKNILRCSKSGNDIRREIQKKQKINNENKDYLAETILCNHAELILKYRYAWIVCIVVGFFLTTFYSTHYLFFATLIASALVCYCNIKAARYFLTQQKTQNSCRKWYKLFFAIQFAYGLVWCSLFIVVPYLPKMLESLPLITTIILMALAILSAHNLRFGVLATLLPCLVSFSTIYIMQHTINQFALPLGLALLVILFEYLSSLMRHATLRHYHSHALRDQLIIELEEATAISDIARRRAEEANLAKSRFLATMSHELRTPLNAIIGFSESMTNEIMGPLQNKHYKEYAKDIHSSGAHLLKLINEILDLSRIEAGQYEMTQEPVNLSTLAFECQQMVKMKAGQKRISLIMQTKPDLENIKADTRAMRQIILNLLSNALKFTPEDGQITLKTGHTPKGGQYICIKDSGPGIPAEEIPLVLSSFGQGSIAIKSAEQGTGLGLPIVQALVHKHNGHFSLQSKLREGTEVVVSFPPSLVLPNNKAA